MLDNLCVCACEGIWVYEIGCMWGKVELWPYNQLDLGLGRLAETNFPTLNAIKVVLENYKNQQELD